MSVSILPEISSIPGTLVSSINDFHYPEEVTNLYIDFETTSGDDKIKSLNPHKHCEILGFNFTYDDHEMAYYLPMRHRDNSNLEIEPCLEYLFWLIDCSKNLIGHNLKYDMHVAINSGGIDSSLLYSKTWYDVRTLAKIINSDRLSYDMDGLSRDWLFEDIRIYSQESKAYTHNKSRTAWRIHDYAVIPAEIMAPYACQDAQTTRKLYLYCQANCPEECRDVWKAEVKLTKELFKIERTGARLNISEVVQDGLHRVPTLLERIEERLHKLSGEVFRANVNADCERIICDKYGLPIIERTKKTDKASFSKDALREYYLMEVEDENFYRIISLIMRYRKWFKIHTAFLYPYMELCKSHGKNNVRLHTDYNQTVRTGRMASAKPNTQQVPAAARKYIIPNEGHVLIDFDLKQIEYRCIADLIEDQNIISEYNNNPEADYHTLMAERCEIPRGPAKNMNFAVSFGAGKAKTIAMLKSSIDASNIPEGMTLEEYCTVKGKEIYKTYHERVPNLKRTMEEASNSLLRRKFVRNKFGRRRHLPSRICYAAFNTAVQSWAADIMKRITLNLQEKLPNDIQIIAIVHDSWVITCPKEKTEEWIPKIKEIIESTETRMCVPLYASYGMSEENWSKCK